MLFQTKAYLKFLWNSKNQHGVHSPFVFHLLTKCFYDKKPKPAYSILKNYQQTSPINKDLITITKTAETSPKRAKLLFKISQYFQPKTILEIGTSSGLATTALALGNPQAEVTTIETCLKTATIAKTQFKAFQCENIHLALSDIENHLQNITLDSSDETEKFDLIYFNANHSKKEILTYFDLLLPTINNDTAWIFNDIHSSTEIEEAWEFIKKHPKVKVTIDTFQWGFVFFRYEQEKEHFVIRV
jgi:predicted O-methyltransferase YrrM